MGGEGDGKDGASGARERLAADPGLRARLMKMALSLTDNVVADASDLVQEAIRKTLDPNVSPWKPEKQPSLLRHLGSLMNSAASHQRRDARARRFIPFASENDGPQKAIRGRGPTAAPMQAAEPNAEEGALAQEDGKRIDDRLARLRLRLAGDAIALGKIDLHAEGVDDAAAQAARLGCTVREIYRAAERITYHAKRVAAETKAEAADPPAAAARPARSITLQQSDPSKREAKS
jgi:hypothetical protein